MRRGLSVLVLATGLARTAFAEEYLGAERCGQCHVAEHAQWKKTGHALALARLTAVQQKDASCRTCHTLAPGSADPALAGVQCESCHGAGALYAPQHVMRDPALAALYGLEKVTEATCRPCHAGDGPGVRPFDFAEMMKLVRHKEADPAPGKTEPKK